MWSMFPVSMIVMNDTAAYFCGKAFGKKLIDAAFMTLSPNKTWEGFIGAGISTVLYAILAVSIWARFGFLRCTFKEVASNMDLTMGSCQNDHLFTLSDGNLLTPAQWISIGLALFASTVAPFGGFAASATKRAFKIKDFDSLFPGHGGFTDRMDCQFIMGMAAWISYTTFISNPHLVVPYDRIVRAAQQLDTEQQLRLVEALQNMIQQSQ